VVLKEEESRKLRVKTKANQLQPILHSPWVWLRCRRPNPVDNVPIPALERRWLGQKIEEEVVEAEEDK
jgi:hypothetical protein